MRSADDGDLDDEAGAGNLSKRSDDSGQPPSLGKQHCVLSAAREYSAADDKSVRPARPGLG